jgi:hypothetical protein
MAEKQARREATYVYFGLLNGVSVARRCSEGWQSVWRWRKGGDRQDP